jgi:hypothetical protein
MRRRHGDAGRCSVEPIPARSRPCQGPA